MKSKIKKIANQINLYNVFNKQRQINRVQKENKRFPFYEIYNPKLDIKLLDKLALINHQYKFVYFRICKAANSTIVSSLYHAETGQIITSLDNLQTIKDTYYNKPTSLSYNELKKFQSHYFKFTFVRNPYTRIISAYLNKIIPNEDGKRNQVAKFIGKSPDAEISFSDFLEYLEQGGINQNAHWARQSDLISIPLRELDFIGKTENITDDLNCVLEKIFKNEPQIISVREHQSSASQMLKEIDLEVKAKIYRIYKLDFDNFNYSSEIK